MSRSSSTSVSSAADLRALTGADFTFSDEQWAAISAPPAPAVVIAGAGSGKTELMAARVVYLVATGQVRPDEVLGLTFTTKATVELGERIRRMLACAGLDGVSEISVERLEPTVATYNAYAAALLGEHGLRIGYEPDQRVLGDAARYQLAGRVIDRHRGVVRALSDHPATVIRYLLALDGAMSEHLVSVDDVRGFDRRERDRFEASLETSRAKAAIRGVIERIDQREELLDLVAGYRALKRQYGLLDFSDQIAGACRLAAEHPEVGEAERATYRVVLLDEYQDTSVAQARMLSGLFSGATPQEGRGHPVTAVGDPHQAIYGWRGASVSNILHFERSFPASDGSGPTVYPLTVNRRSDQRILDVANELVAPLTERTDAVRPLGSKPEAGAGEVRSIVHATSADELAWLADAVRDAHERFGSWREIGVLVRTNDHAAEVYDALSTREIPVEIVGLGGLIRLPEVADVVATLSLLEDLTANAAMLTLLAGPRWAIGPRDLALLGRRSRDLAGVSGPRDEDDDEMSVTDALQKAVRGTDPTEVPSLADALADPGDLPYSEEARERFRQLAAELRHLRGFVGEPLLDLLRRIIEVTGIDVELASSVSPAAAARRDNLELFVRAVADFQAIDGEVTLSSLMAWLQAEDDFGAGLDAATPTEADSVKLLTVHRAKGLEYDAVFLVGVVATRFPHSVLRSQWTTRADVLPAPLRGDAFDLPQLQGHGSEDLKRFLDDARRHQDDEELRLGYVAFTRARHLLWVSSYTWARTIKPFAPSPYQVATHEVMARWGARPDGMHVAEDDEVNPLRGEQEAHPWPVAAPTPEAHRRRRAAERVRAHQAGRTSDPGPLARPDASTVADWDHEIERLLDEARSAAAPEIVVPLPTSLSATSLARLRDDRDAFARDLARPMPRRPVAAARFGTRFHAWVEARFGQTALLDPEDLPGRGDLGIDDDADLREVIARFEVGPFADRVPLAVEPAFALVLAGQVVRGRIDAVYDEPAADGSPGFLVVDWKTNQRADADPLQLAVYRLAWAEHAGVPVERVRAAFHYVRSGETVEPPELPSRDELVALLTD